MLVRPEAAVSGGNLLGHLWWGQLIQHHGKPGQIVPADESDNVAKLVTWCVQTNVFWWGQFTIMARPAKCADTSV